MSFFQNTESSPCFEQAQLMVQIKVSALSATTVFSKKSPVSLGFFHVVFSSVVGGFGINESGW